MSAFEEVDTCDVVKSKVTVRRLTIGEVQECMELTVGKVISSCEHLVYGIPPAFLRAAIDGYDALEYEQLPDAVEEFSAVNPTVVKDVTMVIVQQNQEV